MLIEVKELDYIERLNLALKYSISEQHKKSIIKRLKDFEQHDLEQQVHFDNLSEFL